MDNLNRIGSEPTYLIEMSHQHRHIIMRRAYFLRSMRTRTMMCREKIAGKSWLEVTFIEKAKQNVLPWDEAHRIVDSIKAELRADAYVEPASESGRHHQLTAPPERQDPFDADRHNDATSFGMHDPMSMLNMSSGRSAGPGFGIGGRGFGARAGAGFGAGMGLPVAPGMPGVSGMPSIPGMPNLNMGSPFGGGIMDDFLPAHVRDALSFGEKKSEIALPALRELPAFQALSKCKQDMFEVEAVQALREMMAQVNPSEHSGQSLHALSVSPAVSKRLKQFLIDALPVASSESAG